MKHKHVQEQTFKPRRGSIQKRILSVTITCLIGMCMIISSVSYYIFQNYLKKSLMQSTENSVQLLADTINSSISDIYRMVRFCQTNADIAEYIEHNPNPGSVLSVATYDRISEEYKNNPSGKYMPRLAVITNEHFLQIVSATYSSVANLAEEVPKLPYFDELLTAKDCQLSTGFITDPFNSKRKQIIPIIRPITYQFNAIQGGYLFLEISGDLFTDALKRYSLAEDSHLYLTMGNHIYQYRDGMLQEINANYDLYRELMEEIQWDSVAENQSKTDTGQSPILVTAPLNMPDCCIIQSISLIEFQSQKRLLTGILLGIIISIIAFGVVLMLMMNRMINIPVSKIRARMLRIAEGDFSRDASIEWDHELGEIGKGINDLSENVCFLMNKRLEDEKQKKDLEYKMLQSQINPHFIYNTLNSIKWMASIQGATGISEMTTALAKLLKSISKGTSLLVPIREELSLLQDYFTIQSYRYGGTVTMKIQVDEESIYDCCIINFTLQPIVENAIFHGIEPKGFGEIKIHAYYEKTQREKRDILIEVRDNGVGIPAEKATEILLSNRDSSADFFREIGVSNVHKRLQYEFGEAYGITIDSVEGEYTTMTIRIPEN